MSPKEKTLWDHYSKQLFSLGHGWPVWDGDPEDDPKQEIQMGSVAYPFDGRLWTIMNALKPPNDPINLRSGDPLPDDIEMLTDKVLINKFDAITQAVLRSHTITSGEFSGELGGGR